MESKETIQKLSVEISALSPKEKLLLLQKLQHPADPVEQAEVERKYWEASGSWKGDDLLRTINESKYYATIAPPQLHDPVAIASERGKELPERYEPSHNDLNEIFGGFQSSQSAEELVEEIYKLRTVGTERESLNE
jgi:hypothetical protein